MEGQPNVFRFWPGCRGYRPPELLSSTHLGSVMGDGQKLARYSWLFSQRNGNRGRLRGISLWGAQLAEGAQSPGSHPSTAYASCSGACL